MVLFCPSFRQLAALDCQANSCSTVRDHVHSDEHADEGPYDRGREEHLHDPVVVRRRRRGCRSRLRGRGGRVFHRLDGVEDGRPLNALQRHAAREE